MTPTADGPKDNPDMNNTEVITTRQLYRLIVMIILPTALLSIPTITLQKAGNGGWLSPVISMMVGGVVFVCMYILGKAFPGESFVAYIQKLIGIPAGKVIGLIYGFYFWTSGLVVAMEMIGLIQAAVLLKTPLLVLLVCIFGALAYMLYSGLEGIARVSDLIFVLPFLLTTILIIVSIGSFHKTAFLPLFDHGWSGVLQGSYVPASWFGEIVFIGMLLPCIRNPKRLIHFSLRGLLLTALHLVLIIAVVTSVMGAREGSRAIYPTYNVIRYLQWGEFFEHVDALFLIPWIALMILKILLFYYTGILCIAESLQIAQYKTLILPIFTLSTVLGTWLFPDKISFMEFLYIVYPVYALFLQLILPLFLVGIYLFRSKHLQGGTTV
jgi:spore germination protein KB